MSLPLDFLRAQSLRDIILKAWRIAIDKPEVEFDVDSFYDLIREGAEARKKLAEGDRQIKEFLAGRMEEASEQFDVTLKAVSDAVVVEREECAKSIEEARSDNLCEICKRRLAELVRSRQ
jgi:hypothetical protein